MIPSIHVVKDLKLRILKPLIEGDETVTPDQAKRALDILSGRDEKPLRQQPEPFMTLKAAAKSLGVSACSLWRWGVPGHVLGGRRKTDRAAGRQGESRGVTAVD